MDTRKDRLRFIVACCVAFVLCSSARARTWNVEKDGSGDFTVIQDAIDAASSGDTIRIGPGRFEEHRVVSGVNGGSGDVHFYVNLSTLNIIGAGREQTVVGPAALASTQLYGLFQDVNSENLTIQGISFENLYEGVNVGGLNVTFDACKFRNLETGICSVALYATTVTNSTFIDCSDRGMLLLRVPFGTPQSSVVSNSSFERCFGGIVSQFGSNQISACTIEGSRIGLGFQASAQATITGTTITDYEVSGIDIRGGASVTASDCVIGVGPANVYLAGGGLTGQRMTLAGGTLYTIAANASSAVMLSDSHVLNVGGWSFQAGGDHTIRIFDLRNNWWGTTDAAQIESWIDPGVHTVLYQPFYGMPVRATASSFGQLKARFGEQ